MKCAGWFFYFDSGPGWYRAIIIDRTARRYFYKMAAPGYGRVQEITRERARELWKEPFDRRACYLRRVPA